MILLTVAGMVLAVVLIVALLVWLGMLLFRVRGHGRKVAKVAGLVFIVICPLVVFCVFPIVMSQLIVNAGTRPMDVALKMDPGTAGCEFETVGFEARDGVNIGGWWMKGTDEPAFIIAHGLFRDAKEVVERACQLNKSGFPVLVINLRGHGTSQRSRISMGYLERNDFLGAHDWLSRQGAEKIVLMGVSMGAVASLFAAAESGPDVVAVVADSPFASLRETVSRHVKLFLGVPNFPFGYFFVWNFARVGGFSADDFDTRKAVAKKPDCPVLLIYGEDDQRMPAETAQQVFEAIPSKHKELVFFPGAGHGHAWETNPDRYLQVIQDFLSSNQLVARAGDREESHSQ